jgi:hypothetical protein
LLSCDCWQVKLSKCSFGRQQITYLGHIISQAGVSTDPSKVETVVSWPVPQTSKELRGFLGLAGYYWKLVRNFGVIAKPLIEMLKKNTVLVWTSIQDTTFQALKQALSSAPVLALPNFNKPFSVETDASGKGIGAVLQQDNHPLAFVSKALGALSTYEKEYLAILFIVSQWCTYLQYAEFYIYTYQHSLSHLNEQRLHTPWKQKVFTKLLGLQYKIIYKKGVDNNVADTLSRRPHEAALFALSATSSTGMQDVVDGYQTDEEALKLLAALAISEHPPFTLHNGVIKYGNRVWLGTNVPLQTKVTAALHSSALGGHSGFPITYSRIKQLFHWPRMKSFIREFVAACEVEST